MSEKFATLKIKLFFDSAGKATCCLDVHDKKCQFLGFKLFGAIPACTLGNQVDLFEDVGGVLLRPHNECLLHKQD